VEQAEGARVRLEERHDERDRRQGALAAGEERDRRQLLARGPGHDLQALLHRVAALRGLEDDVGLAASEDLPEDGPELLLDEVEGLLEQLARFLVQVADQLLELALR